MYNHPIIIKLQISIDDVFLNLRPWSPSPHEEGKKLRITDIDIIFGLGFLIFQFSILEMQFSQIFPIFFQFSERFS